MKSRAIIVNLVMKSSAWIALSIAGGVGAPRIFAQSTPSKSSLAKIYASYVPANDVARITDVLQGLDLSEVNLSKLPHITFVSAESTLLTGEDITNRIHLFETSGLDIWLMRQRQSSKEGDNPERWSLVSLIVDHTKSPTAAYFLEFAPGRVGALPKPIAPRVPCLRCHPNGPRKIRPLKDSARPAFSATDRVTFQAFNQKIAKAGVISGYSPKNSQGASLLDERRLGATEPLTLPKCFQCHDSQGKIRHALERQNASSIIFLTTFGHDALGYARQASGLAAEMPIDDEPLTAEESQCLNAWLRRQPLLPSCLEPTATVAKADEHPIETINKYDWKAFTVTEDSRLIARVKTSLGGFVVDGLIPRGRLQCDAGGCSGILQIALASATSGISVRDRHIRQILRLEAGSEEAYLHMDAQPMPIGQDGGPFYGNLTLAGFTRKVEGQVHCQAMKSSPAWTCVLEPVKVNLMNFGLELPHFLGIEVDPKIEVKGKIVLRLGVEKEDHEDAQR